MKEEQKSELYKKVEKFVNESFSKGRHQHSAIHCKLTADAVLEIKPDADETLVIAALAHDIDRAFNDRKVKEDEYQDKTYLKLHQETSAQIISDFLANEGVEQKFIDKVKSLVSKHEIGGDDDQNLIKDADSISYFRGGNSYSIKKKYPQLNLKGKIDWMYNRITSEKAKKMVASIYKKELTELIN